MNPVPHTSCSETQCLFLKHLLKPLSASSFVLAARLSDSCVHFPDEKVPSTNQYSLPEPGLGLTSPSQRSVLHSQYRVAGPDALALIRHPGWPLEALFLGTSGTWKTAAGGALPARFRHRSFVHHLSHCPRGKLRLSCSLQLACYSKSQRWVCVSDPVRPCTPSVLEGCLATCC